MKIPNILHDEDAEIEDVQEYDTLEEALAAAFVDCPPGHVVVVHESGCESDGVDESTCSCEPTEYVCGAQA